jgi:class 3 adenylate cyclase
VSEEAEVFMDEVEEFLTGARRSAELDRFLTTVAFTDIVGSTEIASGVGDRRWRDLLEVHESVARREIEVARGRLVKLTGDGLVATFDGPARAIRCVESIAQLLGAVGLRIRAGLHTGEVELLGGPRVRDVPDWLAGGTRGHPPAGARGGAVMDDDFRELEPEISDHPFPAGHLAGRPWLCR